MNCVPHHHSPRQLQLYLLCENIEINKLFLYYIIFSYSIILCAFNGICFVYYGFNVLVDIFIRVKAKPFTLNK